MTGAGRARSGSLRALIFEAEVLGAWEALGEGPGVAEKAVELEREISVLVARSPRGEVKVYPAAWNHHEEQILAWSVMPAPLPSEMAGRGARDCARDRRYVCSWRVCWRWRCL